MDKVDFVERAEQAEGPPLEPPSGIPRQWLPGWIRWPVRVLMLPWILLDLYVQKLATGIVRTPFRQEGKCLRRGNCCHYILIPEAKGFLGRLNFILNMQVNGFYPRFPEAHEYEGHRVMVMGCRYLKKDGSCSHYRLRPVICRKWPMIEYFGKPRILKGCGFKAVPRTKNSPLGILKE